MLERREYAGTAVMLLTAANFNVGNPYYGGFLFLIQKLQKLSRLSEIYKGILIHSEQIKNLSKSDLKYQSSGRLYVPIPALVSKV